jgi:hypothetical protein
MLIVATLRLVATANVKHLVAAVAAVGALIRILTFMAPVSKPLGNLNLLIFFVLIVGAMVFAAVPIAFAFALASIGYITLTTSTPDVVVIGRMDEGMSHLILLAVPLFVFLGLLIEMTGMARAMVGFLACAPCPGLRREQNHRRMEVAACAFGGTSANMSGKKQSMLMMQERHKATPLSMDPRGWGRWAASAWEN